jgi:glycosyltransferase involved in cell wall biosynthesis
MPTPIRPWLRRHLVRVAAVVLIRVPVPPTRGRSGALVERSLVHSAKRGGQQRTSALAAADRLASKGGLRGVLMAARIRLAATDASGAERLLDHAAMRWPDAMAIPVAQARRAHWKRNRAALREHMRRAVTLKNLMDVDPAELIDLAMAAGADVVLSAVERVESWPEPLKPAARQLVEKSAELVRAVRDGGSDGESLLVDAVTQPDLAPHVLRWVLDADNTQQLRHLAQRADLTKLGAWQAQAIATKLRRAGDLTVSTQLAVHAMSRSKDDRPAARRIAEVGASGLDVLAQGWRPSQPAGAQSYDPQSRSLAYLLHNSLPYASAGYATRSHGLLSALVRDGWHVHGATRLGYPYDTWDDNDYRVPQRSDEIDGVLYHRLLNGRRPYPKWPIGTYLDDYSRLVEQLAIEHRVSVIHAASNYWNGLAAINVAHRLGLPSIYEVRGLWELTRISREAQYEGSELFRLTAEMEVAACHEVDQVLTITGSLRDLMVNRGVPEEKITVLPNGVDAVRFVPRPRDQELAQQLGLTGKVVIGYVGSILDYEGIDTLLHATARMKGMRDDFHVLIVGDGAAFDQCQALAGHLSLADLVTFTGRVPHHDVERYYSLVDVAPFPRKPLPVCEAVSPLKPFEAMAMGKVPVVSSVAALQEIVDHGTTGLVFAKGDVEALTTALNQAVGDAELRARLGAAARDWVVRERDWSVLVKQLEQVYSELESGPARPARASVAR